MIRRFCAEPNSLGHLVLPFQTGEMCEIISSQVSQALEIAIKKF